MRRIVLSLVVSVVLCFVFSGEGSLLAQLDFGRTVGSGDWVDGNWIDDLGGTGVNPGSDANVYLGFAGAVGGSVEPVSVSLSTGVSVNSVQLGNTEIGNLTIQSGGQLDLVNGISVINGTLTVESGGTLNTSILYQANPTAQTLLQGSANIDLLFGFQGSTTTIDSSIFAGSVQLGDSTLNVNETLTSDFVSISQSNFNLTGQLNTQTLVLDNAALTIGSGGSFTAQSLQLYNQSIVLDGSDLVSHQINASNSTVTLDATTNLSGSASFYQSTLNLNQDLTVANELALNNVVLNRGANGNFTASSLVVTDMSFDLGATDSIDSSLVVQQGAQVNVNSSLHLTNGIFVDGSGAQVTLNAATQSDGFLWVSSFGLLEINADTNANSIQIYDGTVTLNSGTLSGSLNTFSGSNIVRNGGTLQLFDVYLSGTSLMLVSGDSISGSLSIDGSGLLTYSQSAGDIMGLSLDSALVLEPFATVHLNFDGLVSSGLDWALSMTGDQSVFLQGLIDSGNVTWSGTSQSVGVIYDLAAYGDRTYLGYIVSVPEPSLSLFAGSILALALVRKRRK